MRIIDYPEKFVNEVKITIMPKLLSTTTADTGTLCYRVREATGLPQAAFAKKLGVSRASIDNWESGKRRPSGAAQKALEALAKRYKVKL